MRPELLAQLNLRVGDDLLIGTQRFQIRGVIQSEPGRNLGAFTLGSRVFIDFADLPSTGLLSFGSRASYQLLLQVPSPPPLPGRRDPSLTLAAELSKAFVNEFIGVRSYRQNEGRMNREPDAGRELPEPRRSGGSDPRRHRRLERDARVRAAEGPKHRHPEVRGELVAPGARDLLDAGPAARARRERARRRACRRVVLQLLPVFVGDLAAMLQVDYGLTLGAVLQGLAVGLLVSLLFSVVPLLEVRNVKPSLLLRQDVPPLPQFDWVKWSCCRRGWPRRWSAWRRGRRDRCGSACCSRRGFVAIAFVLHLAGVALIRAVQPLRYARSFALAPGRAARGASRQPDAHHPAGGRSRHVLHPRRRALQANLLQRFARAGR